MNYFNYFSEIEETFVRRRGKHLLLSPIDWALIETWQERGVPLHVVLRGIEKVFDSRDQKAAPQKRSVKSLFYCREEIEAQYAEWLERQVGKNGASETDDSSGAEEFSDESIRAHLENVRGALKAAGESARGDLREALERASARLDELQRTFNDAEILEKSLEDLEKTIDRALLETPEIKDAEGEIERSLAAYKNKMETETYRHTFDLMLLKRLRERAGIPRLSLFYL